MEKTTKKSTRQKGLEIHKKFFDETSPLIADAKKKDGRQNNGAKPGEVRKKPYAEQGKRTRPRWSHHFKPEHLERIQASGQGVAATVEKALDMLFAWEDSQPKQ